MTYQRASINLASLAPDLIPQDAPQDVWNTGNNVFFRNGETVRVAGDLPTLPGASTPIKTIVYMEVIGAGFWLYCTNTGVYVHDGTTETDVTPIGGWAGLDTATFTSCVLNGIGYINASDRDPCYWAGDPVQVAQPLPDWPTDGRCLALRAHKNFLFGVGFISEGTQRVRWSDSAAAGEVPGVWTPGSDNLAGFADLAPLSSPCLDGETLRDSFLVYKGESVWAFDFIGGNFAFQLRQLFSEAGIAATNAVTQGIDDVHLFAGTDGDVYLTDGASVRSILDGRARRTFAAEVSPDSDAIWLSATLAYENSAIIGYPTPGNVGANRALIYDFISGAIGFRDMPDAFCAAEGRQLLDVGDSNTWDADTQVWDSDVTVWDELLSAQSLDDVLIGGAFGAAVVGRGQAFLTGEIAASVAKSGLAFGDAQTRKMIGRVWPKIIGQNGQQLTFRIGGQEATNGPVTLAPVQTFEIGSSQSIDVFVQGRFMSIDVTSSGGEQWRMGSLDVEFRGVGAW
jgi:hypothetical protein